ncbi:hemin uptake protein HemP [Porticoccus sp. W117]|uniref:hemin uptake protein HemP n=1 Tax=Porticoccus sp. W117 TaxID=3054777 RepID=UPI002596AEF9|nr:hemin uptake protein HemP [Porticoccus sp. W117]MDM3871616.1 hemin uptake protein HemP [Porticoccus sp. W117]
MDIDSTHSQARQLQIKSNIVSSDDLLGNSVVIMIRHGGHFYQLRKTKQNKLILTK